ncbi:MAG: hypothetical protein I8H72_04240 [Myxococcaceae bacterium]|nr:hypothetical protein [Myxococcaceae bacterium]
MTKNDCEQRAAERLLRDFRREHPHLKTAVTEDGSVRGRQASGTASRIGFKIYHYRQA